MNLPVRSWSELSCESISLEAIRKLHTPPSHFRISRYQYTAGTALPGIAHAGRCYVLSGRCSFTVGDWQAEIVSAAYADLPSGSHELLVPGDDPVELVWVWEIPEPYRPENAP
jgi:hypothetical protein